MGMTGMESRPK